MRAVFSFSPWHFLKPVAIFPFWFATGNFRLSRALFCKIATVTKICRYLFFSVAKFCAHFYPWQIWLVNCHGRFFGIHGHFFQNCHGLQKVPREKKNTEPSPQGFRRCWQVRHFLVFFRKNFVFLEKKLKGIILYFFAKKIGHFGLFFFHFIFCQKRRDPAHPPVHSKKFREMIF